MHSALSRPFAFAHPGKYARGVSTGLLRLVPSRVIKPLGVSPNARKGASELTLQMSNLPIDETIQI